MHIVFWGTYDVGKPRVRILIRGLRENGVEVTECHADVWRGIEDKSQVTGLFFRLRLLFRWLASYPRLLYRYLRLPPHDAVIVSYMGHLDVVLLSLLAKWRRTPLVWDAFLSLYDTVVNDRKMISARHPVAFMLHAWELLACRAADLVVLDTKAHAEFFHSEFRVDPHRLAAVLVGAEPERFAVTEVNATGASLFTVLFYGQFIPLHGIDTIIRAARLLEGEPVTWVLIGKGQEAARIQALLDEQPLSRLQWVQWVRYDELIDWISKADICLGIFGTSQKASRVIPNKIFQIISSGKPLVTRDSVAIRELLSPDSRGVSLVPPGDPRALAAAIKARMGQPREKATGLHQGARDRILPLAVGRSLLDQMFASGVVRPTRR